MTTSPILSRFPRSKTWDNKTQQSIDKLRLFIHQEPQPTISHIQSESVKARDLKGPFYSEEEILRAPPEEEEEGVRELLFEAIAGLGETEYDAPELADVRVEWITRSSATVAREQSSSPLVPERGSGVTILHVHGGGFL